MKPRILAVAGVLATVVLAACGGDDQGDSSSASTTTSLAPTTTATASATFNHADVEFAQRMIPHHQQAIDMAKLALDPKSQAGAEVTSLAKRIAAAQAPEIELMTGWLAKWGTPIDSSMGGSHDMSGMDGMDGMMSTEEMDALGMAHGTDFDQMWLTMMVRHHQGAITMAKSVQAKGKDGEVAALAGRIITAQQAEIDEMTPLIGA